MLKNGNMFPYFDQNHQILNQKPQNKNRKKRECVIIYQSISLSVQDQVLIAINDPQDDKKLYPRDLGDGGQNMENAED